MKIILMALIALSIFSICWHPVAAQSDAETPDATETPPNTEVPSIAGNEKLAMTLTVDDSQVTLDKEIGINMKIENLGSTRLEIEKVNLLLPTSWGGETREPEKPVIKAIEPNSIGLIRFKVDVPHSIHLGTYTIFANLELKEGTQALSFVGETNLTVSEKKNVDLANVEWNDITVLLLIYMIPGVVIERVVEAIKGAFFKIKGKSRTSKQRWLNWKWAYDEGTVKALDAMLEKLKQAAPELNKEADYLDRYRAYYTARAHEQFETVARTYLVAFIFSIIPAIALTLNGVGLLQLLGVSPEGKELLLPNEVLLFDSVTAMFAITFLTKPSHEVFRLIEAIRTARKGGAVTWGSGTGSES